MKRFQKIFTIALLALIPVMSNAQNGSSSSYSRFGLGTMAEQSQTFNRAMGGVAYGLRTGSRVNMLNPASYSCIDSLSFLFDVGMSGNFGRLSANGATETSRNATLTNINAGFHVAKNLGMSFGFMPYSTIGYTFANKSNVGSTYPADQKITRTDTYIGQGGIQQLYIGAGWKPFADLSIGVNISYLWGTYNHTVSQLYSTNGTTNTDFSSSTLIYDSDLSTYKLDFGVQYPIRISKKDWLTVGATYSYGHKLGSDVTRSHYTSQGDTTTYVADKPFSMPHTIGVGLGWMHKNNLLIGVDYTLEKWADCTAPSLGNESSQPFVSQKGLYTDRTKIAAGAEYIPNPESRNYMETVKYRLGFNYATPYTKVNGHDGPTEYRATIGFGLPLQTRRLGGRSTINISAEWLHRKPSVSTLIKENYIILNVGLLFNEKWFMKWKID